MFHFCILFENLDFFLRDTTFKAENKEEIKRPECKTSNYVDVDDVNSTDNVFVDGTNDISCDLQNEYDDVEQASNDYEIVNSSNYLEYFDKNGTLMKNVGSSGDGGCDSIYIFLNKNLVNPPSKASCTYNN